MPNITEIVPATPSVKLEIANIQPNIGEIVLAIGDFMLNII
jgi:hypothetical protein